MILDKIKNIKIEDFDYPLPEERIALHPLPCRDGCKMIVRLPDGTIEHRRFSDLPDYLSPGTLLLCNETRVINARMEFFRPSGGRIEVFVLEPDQPSDYVLAFAARRECVWTCMIGNLKKWKERSLEKSVDVPGVESPVILTAELLPLKAGEEPSASRRIRFSWDNPDVTFASLLEAAGNIPIPPYLKRESEESDLTDYQTVYSRVEGSVAAPTAGLHFTPELFGRLRLKGVSDRKVTLHVGAGTFQPVKSVRIGEHPMHTESVHVELDVIGDIIKALEEGRPVAAVGTTTVRTIESLPYFGYLAMSADVSDVEAMHVPQWLAYDDEPGAYDTLTLLKRLRDELKGKGLDYLSGSTAIMIAPGFRWRVIGRMITNFHQPQSTLLLLVSSFLGREEDRKAGSAESSHEDSRPEWRRLYDEALANGYRFLSYGDACLL